MSTGTWDPSLASATPEILTPALLQRLAAASRDERLDDLESVLTEDERQSLAGLMQLDHAQWHGAAGELPDDEILHLLRFFAVAENLPGWEAGANSPVIPLAKILRGRGRRLDRDLLLWLREVNENRYLPYGPL